eukprot:g23647.t1
MYQYQLFKERLDRRESARPGAETCPLLSRLRLELAKRKIDEPTIEYAAFSRYLQSVREDCEPVLLEKPRDWYARFWNLDYFKRDCGHDYWFCRPQFPAFDGDEAAIDQVALHVSIAEYVEFARTLQRMDRKWLPDMTPRLAQVFAHAFSLQDPVETLSRFYKVTLAATGSITRLHVEVAGAHSWFNQIEGRRVSESQ